MDFHQLAALTGASIQTSVILPQLQVNREPEDDEGHKLPMGYFTVIQNEQKAFGKTAIFRPFINAFQYSEYSPKENKFINRSLIIRNFAEEALDMLGGKACGKVPNKLHHTLNVDEQVRQKNIKCRRHLYGLLSIDSPVDVEGKALDNILELPVMWKMGGSNFMAPDIALKSITKMKHQFFQHSLVLTTKREKQGSTIYYTVDVEPNLKEVVELTEENVETFGMFNEVLARENSFISNAWRRVKQEDVKQLSNRNYLKELELNDSVDDL
jgi:hypothetical protein